MEPLFYFGHTQEEQFFRKCAICVVSGRWMAELSTFGHKPYTTDGGLCRDIHTSV
jgi:hypothetical protein